LRETVGQRYTIQSLGTTTNAQWNTIANTSGITYVDSITVVSGGSFLVGKKYIIKTLGTTTTQLVIRNSTGVANTTQWFAIGY